MLQQTRGRTVWVVLDGKIVSRVISFKTEMADNGDYSIELCRSLGGVVQETLTRKNDDIVVVIGEGAQGLLEHDFFKPVYHNRF